jgi:hypothetical protein
MKQRRDVLHDDELGSKLANEAGILEPKTAARSRETGTVSCSADVLTGKSAADNINCSDICASQCGNVPELLNAGPTLRQHLAAMRIDLAECDGLKAVSRLQPQAEPADPAKQIEHFELAHDLVSSLRPRERARDWFTSADLRGRRVVW